MQEAFEKTAAEHLALAASNLTAKPSSSIQHSKDTGPRNAKMAQAVAVQQSNADDHAADSPTLGQQVLVLARLHGQSMSATNHVAFLHIWLLS